MASREQISMMRAARIDDADAQLALGKAYLFGEVGLKINLLSALYWLHRAAANGQASACLLIGAHIPYATVSAAPEPMRFCAWYERAWLEGVPNAALVMAKLILNLDRQNKPLQEKAVATLKELAGRNDPEAQWMLAKELKASSAALSALHQTQGGADSVDALAASMDVEQAALQWATRAAENGIRHARQALADSAWRRADYPAYLHWALAAAREVVNAGRVRPDDCAADERCILLAARCASALLRTGAADAPEIEPFLQYAAGFGDPDAQYLLGCWCANLDEDGQIVVGSRRRNKFKKAIYWLALACEKADARAWYAMYKIYTRPNSGLYAHSLLDAERCIERSAEMGYRVAQWELGAALWRAACTRCE